MTQQPLFTPAFVGLSVANFCNSMIFYLLVPVMASHAVNAFGATSVEAGTLASIFFIGALAARLFAGWATDRFGPRAVAIAGATFYVVTTAAYLASPSLAVMMVVRTLNGVAFGFLGSALISGVMMNLPQGRRAEGSGWFSVGISVGVGLGPWLALTLAASTFGMSGVFVAAVITAAMGLALVLAFRSGLPGQRPDVAPAPLALGSLLDHRAMGMGTVMLLGGFAYSAILTFLDPATHGTPLAAATSWFFLVYAVFVVVVRPVAGKAQDRLGEGRILAPALVVFTIAMSVAAAANSVAVLLLSSALLAVGWGTATTGGQAAIVSRVPRERTGAAIATHFFMLDLGTGLGPIILAALVPGFGYTGVFWAAAACTLLALPAYLVDLRRHQRRMRAG